MAAFPQIASPTGRCIDVIIHLLAARAVCDRMHWEPADLPPNLRDFNCARVKKNTVASLSVSTYYRLPPPLAFARPLFRPRPPFSSPNPKTTLSHIAFEHQGSLHLCPDISCAFCCWCKAMRLKQLRHVGLCSQPGVGSFPFGAGAMSPPSPTCWKHRSRQQVGVS